MIVNTPSRAAPWEAVEEKTTITIDEVKCQELANPIVKNTKQIEDESCQERANPITTLDTVFEEHTMQNDEEKSQELANPIVPKTTMQIEDESCQMLSTLIGEAKYMVSEKAKLDQEVTKHSNTRAMRWSDLVPEEQPKARWSEVPEWPSRETTEIAARSDVKHAITRESTASTSPKRLPKLDVLVCDQA